MHASLRIATPADAAAIRSIYAPYVESTAITFETEIPTTEEMTDRIEQTHEQYPWLVCETENEGVVGYATASSLRSKAAYAWAVELTVYVTEDVQQSGVGTALYTTLLEILREQGYVDAYAAVTLPNTASVRLHEKFAFEPVGTFPAAGYKQESWRDVQWWHRQLGDRPRDPDPPTPMSAMRDSPALETALRTGEASLREG
ncbi:Acyltransferase protein [Halorhabdus tiamatea SARL4B]|uniref:Acyltransferase protein n=1 Tax=Halorhabdus tiamatea SARL4B TaxID=1033806 RepID=F7PGA0_9EURY|nr:GNAT family N-acetyltransferase [Halorhabdus tiamatea]ERJ05373.1 Acyltransferase protein [Halorhabdus tiamatea SARL4B]CCQ33156.1 GCN5-related N-acetyltransferase [Halorhabdus tiamatea SARL4B]